MAPDRVRVVFILAQFGDLVMGRPRAYFSDPERRDGLVERLVDYYAEVSHGHLVIEPTVTEGIVTVAQPRARYRQKPAALIRDAARALLATPTERAAHAALETADAVIVFFAGPGQESDLRGGARDPWSNFTVLVPPVVTPGGRRLGKGCVIAASQREGLSSFGVLCHEFGHLLGLPELYAPGGAAHEGIGVWGLMGQGTWLGRGDRPPHPSAWCKVAMGWANVEIISTSGRITLPAVDHSGRVVKLWASGPEQPWAYVLIENRQRRGADGRLPGSGLLVWRIDERVGGFRSSQSDPDRLRVRLIQADGRDDLRSGHRGGGNRGDATDTWRGMGWGARRCLDAAVLAGLALVALGGLRCARRRGADAGVGVMVITGLLLGVIGISVPRSPTLRSEDILAGLDLGSGAAARFTISEISRPGDPMTFTVRITDRGTPH